MNKISIASAAALAAALAASSVDAAALPPQAPTPFASDVHARQEARLLVEPLSWYGFVTPGWADYVQCERARYDSGNKSLLISCPNGEFDATRSYMISVMRGGIELGRLYFWGVNWTSGVENNFGYPYADVQGKEPRWTFDRETQVSVFTKAYIDDKGVERTFTVTLQPEASTPGRMRLDWDTGIPASEAMSHDYVISPWFVSESGDWHSRTVRLGSDTYVPKPDEQLLGAGEILTGTFASGDLYYAPDEKDNGFSMTFEPAIGSQTFEQLTIQPNGTKKRTWILRGDLGNDTRKVAGTVWFDFGETPVTARRPAPLRGIDFWGTDAMEVPARPTRNLIPNPGFEQGLRYWRYMPFGSTVKYKPVPRDQERYVVTEGGLGGGHALRVRSTQKSSDGFEASELHSLPIPLEAGKRYTLSCYVRGAPGKFGWLITRSPSKGAFSWGMWSTCLCQSETEWTRNSFQINDGGEGGIVITIVADDGVEFDRFQLEEGDMTDWTCDPVEGRLVTNDEFNDLDAGSPIGARFGLSGAPGTAANISFSVENAFREKVWTSSANATVGADGTVSVPIDLDGAGLGQGVFVLRADYSVDGFPAWSDFFRFSVMKPLTNTHATKDIFGSLVNALDGICRGGDLARKYMRWGIGSTTWGVTSDMTGERNLLGFLKQYNIKDYFRPIADETPSLKEYLNWTSVTPEMEAEIEQVAYDTVRTNDSVFTVWGFGNEEEYNGYLPRAQMWDEYAKAQLACYRGVKRANPDALVVPTCGTCQYNPGYGYDVISNYIYAALRQGVKYDAIAVHQYYNVDGGILGENDMDTATQHLADEMRNAGYPDSAPILTTEMFNKLDTLIPQWACTGWGDTYHHGRPTYDFSRQEFLQAASAARIFTIGLRHWPKLQCINIWSHMPVVDADLAPVTLCKVFNTFGNHFPDVAWYGTVRNEERRIRGYVFRTPQGTASAAIWTYDREVELGNAKGETLRVAFAERPDVYDFMGNERTPAALSDGRAELPLTPAPLILHASSPQLLLAALAEASGCEPILADGSSVEIPTDTEIELVQGQDVPISGNAFTIAIMVTPQPVEEYREGQAAGMVAWVGNGWDHGFRLRMEPKTYGFEPQLELSDGNGPGNLFLFARGTQMPAGQPSHFVATWDGAVARLYINGREVASGAFAKNLSRGDGLDWGIGGYNWYGLANHPFTNHGLRIWDEALTADQVASLAASAAVESGETYIPAHDIAAYESRTTAQHVAALDAGTEEQRFAKMTRQLAFIELRRGVQLDASADFLSTFKTGMATFGDEKLMDYRFRIGAQLLKEGRVDEALGEFTAVWEYFRANGKVAAPPSALGLAKALLAKGDSAGAASALAEAASLAYPLQAPEYRGASPEPIAAYAPPSVEPAVVFSVAPWGDDSSAGDIAHPFATLARARDAVRALARPLRAGGVLVDVRGGYYRVRETLELGASDSGEEGAPVVWRAHYGERPVFGGGIEVADFSAQPDEAVTARFLPEVRGHIECADLAALGYPHTDALRDYSLYQGGPNIVTDVYEDGERLQLARWPDAGWLEGGEIVDAESKEFRAGFDLAPWADDPTLMVSGYFDYFWDDYTQRPAKLDAASGTVKLSFTMFPLSDHCRWFILNSARALDRPGEWWLDRPNRKLYVWRRSAASRFTVSDFSWAFMRLSGVSNFSLEGMTFEFGRGNCIEGTGCTNILFAANVVRDFGGDGVSFRDSSCVTVDGNVLCGFGHSALSVSGGVRKTLEPARIVVRNNDISEVERWRRTYAPCVLADGCGIEISHNWMHDAPSSAMRLEGNDHRVVSNRVERVVLESDDQGGIDIFADTSYAGIYMAYNVWRDFGSEYGFSWTGVGGIRLDDRISNMTIAFNRFENCALGLFGAMQIHGGRNNAVDHNYITGCWKGCSMNQSDWESYWSGNEARQKNYVEVDISSDPYKSKYPGISDLPTMPMVNYFTRNVIVGGEDVVLCTGAEGQVDFDNRIFSETPNEEQLLRDPAWRLLPSDRDVGVRTNDFARLAASNAEVRTPPENPGSDPAYIPSSGTPAVYSGYSMAWNDEFNENGAPNSADWTVFTPDTAVCEGGALVLTANDESVGIDGRYAALSTEGLRSFGFGRIEIRAKAPFLDGFHASACLVGTAKERPYGGWYNFLDAEDTWADGGYFAPCVVQWSCWGDGSQREFWSAMDIARFTKSDSEWASKYHVWRMDRDAESIVVSIDGEVLWTHKTADWGVGGYSPYADAGNPFSLFVALDRRQHSSRGDLPQTFAIDYIRYYVPVGSAADAPRPSGIRLDGGKLRFSIGNAVKGGRYGYRFAEHLRDVDSAPVTWLDTPASADGELPFLFEPATPSGFFRIVVE